jgi:NADH:ubiquinone oxidoreductase subunit 6 (subunit J)
MQTGWVYVGTILILFHFMAPFLSLLSSRTKRTAKLLGLTVVLILIMRTVDIFWVIVPSFHRQGAQLLWTDIAAIVGFGGLWMWMFTARLRKQPPLPLNEPRLQEALQHG